MATRKGNTESVGKLLGSFTMLVFALMGFLLVLVYFVPENVSSPDFDKEVTSTAGVVLPAETNKAPTPTNKPKTAHLPSANNSLVAKQKHEEEEHLASDSKQIPTEAEIKKEEIASTLPIDQAVTLIDEGNIEEATDILEKILKEDPMNERALVEMSMIHLIDNRDTQAAVPYLEKALKVNPKQRMVLAELINAYSEGGSIEEGVEYLSNLQEKIKGEDSSYISLGIGQMLMSDNRIDEATKHLDKAVDGLAKNPDLLSNLGDTYSLVGESDKAIGVYGKAVEARKAEIVRLAKKGKPIKQKKLSLLRNQMGIVHEYFKQGKLDEASEQVEVAEKLLPGNHLSASWRKRIERRRQSEG